MSLQKCKGLSELRNGGTMVLEWPPREKELKHSVGEGEHRGGFMPFSAICGTRVGEL